MSRRLPTRAATGTVRLRRATVWVALEMATFGQIQTAPGWASLTGRGRVRPGDREVDIVIMSAGNTLDPRAGDFHYATTR